jgi:hypothetical protein
MVHQKVLVMVFKSLFAPQVPLQPPRPKDQMARRTDHPRKANQFLEEALGVLMTAM